MIDTNNKITLLTVVIIMNQSMVLLFYYLSSNLPTTGYGVLPVSVSNTLHCSKTSIIIPSFLTKFSPELYGKLVKT